MKKSNLKSILREINENINILQHSLSDDKSKIKETDLYEEILRLEQDNKNLVKRLRLKEDENTRLTDIVYSLREELKVSKAKIRPVSVEKSLWDTSFEILYNKKIKKYL